MRKTKKTKDLEKLLRAFNKALKSEKFSFKKLLRNK